MDEKYGQLAFRNCANAAEERYLREMLAMLQESYAKAAKPYVERLTELYSQRAPQVIVMVEQAQALGLMPTNVEFSCERGESAGTQG